MKTEVLATIVRGRGGSVNAPLFIANRDTRPIVGSEGRGGKIGLVVEIALGVIGPGVAHGHGRRDLGDETTTLSPSMRASAQTNFLSLPAMAKPFSWSPPLATSPPPM